MLNVTNKYKKIIKKKKCREVEEKRKEKEILPQPSGGSMCFKLISYAKDVFKILLNSFFAELGRLSNTKAIKYYVTHICC